MKLNYWKQHKFETPQVEEPSYRVVGGTQHLINQLIKQVEQENTVFQASVKAIVWQDKEWQVT